jgi:hypothetical protein
VFSRYILWDKASPSSDLLSKESPTLQAAISALVDGCSDLNDFPKAARLAVRQHLRDAGYGAEVILRIAQDQPMLYLTTGVPIIDLELSIRSSNCLRIASIETLDDLLVWTPDRLMGLPNFGRKCLTEISEVLEHFGYTSLGTREQIVTKPVRGASTVGAPLACLLDVGSLCSDPIARRLRAFGWNIVADLAVHSFDEVISISGLSDEEAFDLDRALQTLKLLLPVNLPDWFVLHTDALLAAFQVEVTQLHSQNTMGIFDAALNIFVPPAKSLNEELLRLIPSRYDEKKMAIVTSLFGLHGHDPRTLDEVALEQIPPLTRERVRQIARPITDALSMRGRNLAQLSKAIESLRRLAPCRVEEALSALLDQRILDVPMTIKAILRLSRRAELETALIIRLGYLLDEETDALLQLLMQAAGKLSSHWGVAYWPEVLASCKSCADRDLKGYLHDVVWLDEDHQYMVLPDRENSLANRLARILKVTPRLTLEEAYLGVFRDVRMQKQRLPEDLFGDFCRIWPWCVVEGEEILAASGLPSSEASGDDLLVLLLREIGYPVRRRALLAQALQQGLSVDLINFALSYSNVLKAENGFVAVIGDRRLGAFASGSEEQEPQRPPENVLPDETELVPDERSLQFPHLLMMAVETRIAALKLSAPWSVSELRLAPRDRDRLLAWGSKAFWDTRNDAGYYKRASGEKVRKRTALGLAFLLFSSEAVRRSSDAGSIWPAIGNALHEAQGKLFLLRDGVPKAFIREAVESACRTFGLRHGFADVGEQVWVRTMLLQYGLQSAHVCCLGEMLGEPPYMQPIGISLLLDQDDPNGSASFLHAWQLLQNVRRGAIEDQIALQRFAESAWLSPLSSEELLRRCRRAYIRSESRSKIETFEGDPYQYFGEPCLHWENGEPRLEFSLNLLAPSWRTSDTLIFVAEDPFRKERVVIEEGRWSLPEGPVKLPLTQREAAAFRFRLIQVKEVISPDWIDVGLPSQARFFMFLASGAMLRSPDDVPLNEPIVLMHHVDLQIAGLNTAPRFELVLRNQFRLLRLAVGDVSHISLFDDAGTLVWSLPQPEVASSSRMPRVLPVPGGKWGSRVAIALPELPFLVESLRLNSGEVLSLLRDGVKVSVKMSPGLAGAEFGFLRGMLGHQRRSIRVALQHLGADFGAAIELHGEWQALDGSATLDATLLRTQRLRAEIRPEPGPNQDVCWMEGNRTLSGLHKWGTSMLGVHGLGASLQVVRGTYNSSQVEVCAANAVTDGGFWRSVALEANGLWSATLPFEEPLEDGHVLWVWANDSKTPYQVPREYIRKSGFTLRWSNVTAGRVFGWAFSINGFRIGSTIAQDCLAEFMDHQQETQWNITASWLRWWHVPVYHPELRGVITKQALRWPLETLKAWTLPDETGNGLVFDELREEAWAGAAREFCWGWRPEPDQAAELAKAMNIWSGDIARDSVHPPAIEAVGLLARVSPLLLAFTAEQALPFLYSYPKRQLAVLLKMILETVNPNAVEPGFRLNELYDRYAKGESRLDGRFISRSLVGAALSTLRGEKAGEKDGHNLRIALHQAGLRELITIALITDVIDRWQKG